MAFFLVDGIVSSWREDVKNHILTDFCRSACFACQLTGLCHPAAFYKVWIHLYIELHCRQFNIASQYVAGIELHFSGPHWCSVFFVSFWLALYGGVPGLSCPSSQLYIWGSCYPRVTHTIHPSIRYLSKIQNTNYKIQNHVTPCVTHTIHLTSAIYPKQNTKFLNFLNWVLIHITSCVT